MTYADPLTLLRPAVPHAYLLLIPLLCVISTYVDRYRPDGSYNHCSLGLFPGINQIAVMESSK
jgi:hypothetical protein